MLKVSVRARCLACECVRFKIAFEYNANLRMEIKTSFARFFFCAVLLPLLWPAAAAVVFVPSFRTYMNAVAYGIRCKSMNDCNRVAIEIDKANATKLNRSAST